ncbi:MAG: hypothetical protein CVV44_03060 [Spirochaetae bacterium HGW-Spirochaetae-1]|nr:MAG: hypothetical protein CVV44_03060 [Spirochaetae bacterium HGW-Spirochaetae-1]
MQQFITGFDRAYLYLRVCPFLEQKNIFVGKIGLGFFPALGDHDTEAERWISMPGEVFAAVIPVAAGRRRKGDEKDCENGEDFFLHSILHALSDFVVNLDILHEIDHPRF